MREQAQREWEAVVAVMRHCGRSHDRALALRIVNTALKAIQTEVSEPTLFEPPGQEAEERVPEPLGA